MSTEDSFLPFDLLMALSFRREGPVLLLWVTGSLHHLRAGVELLTPRGTEWQGEKCNSLELASELGTSGRTIGDPRRRGSSPALLHHAGCLYCLPLNGRGWGARRAPSCT